jgi:hypothetical protein
VGDELYVNAGYTDWSVVNALQERVLSPNAGSVHDELLMAWNASSALILSTGRPLGFPHHLAVHALVVSSDGFVVTGVRDNVTNQAGRLSMSLEEQMQPAFLGLRQEDSSRVVRVDGDDDPVSAVCRGVYEEIGIRASPDQVRLLGVAIERTSVAVNILGLVRVDERISDVLRQWNVAADRHEIALLPKEMSPRFDLNDERLTLWDSQQPLARFTFAGAVHSTCRLRVLLALSLEFGLEETVAAIGNVEGWRLWSLLRGSG